MNIAEHKKQPQPVKAGTEICVRAENLVLLFAKLQEAKSNQVWMFQSCE
jgi:hypothetical protein